MPEKSKKRKRWLDYIELIEMYIEEFENSEITNEFDRELYKWIVQQRTNYRVGKLRAEKAKKLIDLGILTEE
ncbi:MAG TPA: helicase associated domain-containing protein [Draconibacterium sp.]|nr:helicase associated domain-containing protein [Draconibacterium sp.]